jgi:hypothetical protein
MLFLKEENPENPNPVNPKTENHPATPPNTRKIKIKKCVEQLKKIHKNNLI